MGKGGWKGEEEEGWSEAKGGGEVRLRHGEGSGRREVGGTG